MDKLKIYTGNMSSEEIEQHIQKAILDYSWKRKKKRDWIVLSAKMSLEYSWNFAFRIQGDYLEIDRYITVLTRRYTVYEGYGKGVFREYDTKEWGQISDVLVDNLRESINECLYTSAYDRAINRKKESNQVRPKITPRPTKVFTGDFARYIVGISFFWSIYRIGDIWHCLQRGVYHLELFPTMLYSILNPIFLILVIRDDEKIQFAGFDLFLVVVASLLTMKMNAYI